MGQIRLMKNEKWSDGLDVLDRLDMSKKKLYFEKLGIEEIGQKAAQILCEGVCMVAVSFKRFKGVFRDEFLKNGYYGHSLKWAFKELKLRLNGGLRGHKPALKKVGVFPQKWQIDEMPKTPVHRLHRLTLIKRRFV